MPLLEENAYKNPWYLLNGHFETIVPSMRNAAPSVPYKRSRLDLPDGDFLDLDWLDGDANKLVIISHGLEGSSSRHYVRRSAHFFHARGWSVLAWNCRSCSGEMNKLPRFYHHGATEDLAAVVEEALGRGYKAIVLVGFSMGGSMSIKYLGETRRPSAVRGAVTFSVPCNLKDSAEALELRGNRFYERRFLNKLKVKIELKAQQHEQVVAEGLQDIRNFETFHRRYTVPLHGFETLESFYDAATCDQFFEGLEVPVFVGNAWNDPLLINGCYPLDEAEDNPYLHLKTPQKGGHVGFTIAGDHYTWMEYEAATFMKMVLDLV